MNNIFADDNVTQTESVKNTYASSNETTQKEYKQFNKETESDEIVTYIKHYVTFIDKQRNTKRVVDVQHNRSVSELIVSKKPIQYKKNKSQTFMYWATKTKSGYKAFDFSSSIQKDITLYAVYAVIAEPHEKNIVVKQVSFDARNGEKIKTRMIEKHKISEPKDPSKSGYRFLGWYTKPASGKKWDFEKDKSYDDITLYAHWEKITDSYYVSPKTGEDMPKYLYFFAAGCIGVLISAIKLKKQFD